MFPKQGILMVSLCHLTEILALYWERLFPFLDFMIIPTVWQLLCKGYFQLSDTCVLKWGWYDRGGNDPAHRDAVLFF